MAEGGRRGRQAPDGQAGPAAHAPGRLEGGEQSLPLARDQLRRGRRAARGRLDLGPDRAGPEAERLESPLHLGGPRAAALGGIHAGEVEGKEASLMLARDILLAEEEGAAVHIAHLSTARAVELVRAARRRGPRSTSRPAGCSPG